MNIYIVLVFVRQFGALSDIHAMNCDYNLSIIDKETAFQKVNVKKSHFDFRGGQEFKSLTIGPYIVFSSNVLNTQSWQLASNHRHRIKADIPSDWFGWVFCFFLSYQSVPSLYQLINVLNITSTQNTLLFKIFRLEINIIKSLEKIMYSIWKNIFFYRSFNLLSKKTRTS